jgi:bifunctional ADP-heptose synthase (sugar kinase/adenylyltransferase)
MFRVEEGGPAPLDSQMEEQFAALLLDAAHDADAVIFTDFGYGTLTRGMLDRVTPALRRSGAILAADVSGSQGDLLKFRGMDLICPTEREARQCIGDHSSGLGAVVGTLLGRLDSRQALITLGKQGLVTFDWTSPNERLAGERLRSEYIPAFARRGIDPLGCGDALLSTATTTLAAGGDLMSAALLGSYAAALEVNQVGNIPVSAEELLRLTADPVQTRSVPRLAV